VPASHDPSSTVRALAGEDDAADAARVVASAFADYPYWVWIEPDAAARRDRMLAYYRLDLAEMIGAGWSHGLSSGPVLDAVAIWLRSEDLADGFANEASRALGPAATARIDRALAAMEAMAPAEQHWYLDVLAVEPGRQGAGLGHRVLVDGLRRADADGVGCHLETARPQNVTWYQRLGFAVTGEIEIDGLHLWGMWRPPSRS
jgi:ribosomal protein S18 acetylase RimI-like enzyme